MARLTKTVHVDVYADNNEDAAALVRTYGGRVDNDGGFTFICARVPRARLSHFKSTATKKGFECIVDA
jgi:hypothetical protein